jgi:2-hydroxychromene-2-carboxylate isomerase
LAPVFYYDTNSPYAYLAAQRIDEVLPGATWRPIAFAFLLREQGRIPWSMGERRADGIEEVERRAAERGLPAVRWPEGWPRETYSLAPLRAMLLAERHGLLKPLTLALYRRAFVEGRSLAELEEVIAAAEEVGLATDSVRDAIDDPELKQRLRDTTGEALALGVPGVPTVAVGEQLFWGDDRLEEAAAVAQRR